MLLDPFVIPWIALHIAQIQKTQPESPVTLFMGEADQVVGDFNSFGLLGITERALMVNGKVRISSKPGRGTQVLISIPLARKVH